MFPKRLFISQFSFVDRFADDACHRRSLMSALRRIKRRQQPCKVDLGAHALALVGVLVCRATAETIDLSQEESERKSKNNRDYARDEHQRAERADRVETRPQQLKRRRLWQQRLLDEGRRRKVVSKDDDEEE